jgi:hypothetical protein
MMLTMMVICQALYSSPFAAVNTSTRCRSSCGSDQQYRYASLSTATLTCDPSSKPKQTADRAPLIEASAVPLGDSDDHDDADYVDDGDLSGPVLLHCTVNGLTRRGSRRVIPTSSSNTPIPPACCC